MTEKTTISCGVILESNGYILVGHPTNTNMKLRALPKGRQDLGENHLQTAKRELYEETAMDLRTLDDSYFSPVAPVSYYSKRHGNKQVRFFHVDVESLPLEWQKKIHDTELQCLSEFEPGYPEMDIVEWVNPLLDKNIRFYSHQIDALQWLQQQKLLS